MNDLKLVLGFLTLLLGISCQNIPIGNKQPFQQILVKSIVLDTNYGYPYPSNYNWEDLVKQGKAITPAIKYAQIRSC
jgi:hypothetical protein